MKHYSLVNPLQLHMSVPCLLYTSSFFIINWWHCYSRYCLPVCECRLFFAVCLCLCLSVCICFIFILPYICFTLFYLLCFLYSLSCASAQRHCKEQARYYLFSSHYLYPCLLYTSFDTLPSAPQLHAHTAWLLSDTTIVITALKSGTKSVSYTHLTLLIKANLPACSSWSPWEKLNLAISIPANARSCLLYTS